MKELFIIIIYLLSLGMFAQNKKLTINNLISQLENSEFIMDPDKNNFTYVESNNWQKIRMYELFESEGYKIFNVFYDETYIHVNTYRETKSTAHIVVFSKKNNKYLFIHFCWLPSFIIRKSKEGIVFTYKINTKDVFIDDFILTDDKFYNKIPVMINYNKGAHKTEFAFHDCTNDYTLFNDKEFLDQDIDDLIEFILLNKKIQTINECSDLQRLHDLQWMLPYYLRDKDYRNYGN